MPTDPVCGMAVDATPEALRLTRENRTYYFCCQGCLESFAHPEAERRRLALRLAVAWPLAAAVVVLTYAVRSWDAALAAAVLAGIVLGYSGRPFYVGAWDALRHRIGNMDLLIAVGTTAAYLESLAALVRPHGLLSAYYFDAAALIVALILTGNFLEQRARARAGSAVRRLGELLPTTVVRVGPRGEATVALADVAPGDLLRIAPGSRFPVDGTLREGRTSADEAILTGESLPVPKGPGDRVLAGAWNRDGGVVVEVSRVGPDSFVGQVGALLDAAELARVPLQRTADRIAGGFVPAVLALAVASALAWATLGGAPLAIALLVFVTVAITACPCAFGLATPAAILVGTGVAAEEGILFRGPEALERTARLDLVLLDKTGTLTASEPVLARLLPAPPTPADELLRVAAGIARGSPHPFARALTRSADERGVAPADFDLRAEEPGQGIRAEVSGTSARLLRADAAAADGAALAPIAEELRRAEAAGESASVVIASGRLLGAVTFRAPVVPGAAEAVRQLRSLGVDVAMVTGDSETVARRVAAEVGISEVHARADPAAKTARIAEAQARGRTVGFVGDGLNDAPALAAADAGFAIGTGTEVAREAGQVLLVRSDLRDVPEAIRLARRTVARVRSNLFWALGYNAVLLPIAAGALVPWLGLAVYAWLPIAGAAAMAVSSTTVVVGSLALRRARRPDRALGAPAPSPTGASAT